MMLEHKFNSINETPAGDHALSEQNITAEGMEYLDQDFGKGVELESKQYNNFDKIKVPESIPPELVRTESLKESLDSVDLEAIYEWYKGAMMRRDREPLNKEAFIHHFFEEGSREPTYAKGDMEKGFILGFYKYDMFIPTHFAPKSIRTGYELFKELGEDTEMAVATAVTKDLAETLLKMDGWHKMNTTFMSYFSGGLKEKVLVYNSANSVRNKLIKLAKQFWEETKSIENSAKNPL